MITMRITDWAQEALKWAKVGVFLGSKNENENQIQNVGQMVSQCLPTLCMPYLHYIGSMNRLFRIIAIFFGKYVAIIVEKRGMLKAILARICGQLSANAG